MPRRCWRSTWTSRAAALTAAGEEAEAAALREATCAQARALGLVGVARSVEAFAAAHAPPGG